MSAALRVTVLLLTAAIIATPNMSHGQDAPGRRSVSGQHGHSGSHPDPEEPQQPPSTKAADHPEPGTSVEAPAGVMAITEEDRAAAGVEPAGQHTVHDRAVHSFVLFERAEWQGGDGGNGLTVDSTGWVGQDITRLWFRADGEVDEGSVQALETHLLYGRMVARWWDVVAGVRQDFRPGPSRTWAAVGLQGLAPYWFEVEATAYIGAGGRTQFRFETEYELLLTNRLILQPMVEVEIHGRSDPERGIGAGLSTVDAGLRLRYEFRREFAPYVGLVWNRKFFGTADFAKAAGEGTRGTRLAAGVRFWF